MEIPPKEDLIFALDIGTRTVIGIVCCKKEDKLCIMAQSIMEHDSRSMIDGQVHDIDKVADVVIRVKDELEKKVGFPLKEAAIAAAGRTLKTKYVHVDQDLGDDIDIKDTVINSLELYGVNEAKTQIEMELKQGQDSFYCVGYTVMSYYLNGYSMTNLLNHKGRYIGADVLATFLPQSVVSSLYKVLDKSGLTPISLTLEPIAAIEAVVPEGIRMINLVLVDIGAGTSDIAITKNGTIVAYSMVPVAGDEVTETIANEYLVDFNIAESIKKSIGKKKRVTFKDIMGTKNSVAAHDVLKSIEGMVERLSKDISSEILRYNENIPKAVLCVGGGSQTPMLLDFLSRELNLDKHRITIKNMDAVPNLEVMDKILRGPETVTVIGIALVAFKKMGGDFINIYINGKEHKVFNAGELRVRDVLGLASYDPNGLIARSGKNINFTLNGKSIKVFGEAGIPPEIYVNDNLSNLNSIVRNGDFIRIRDAVKGKDACVIVRDIIRYNIDIEGKNIYANGELVSLDYTIKDGDSIIAEENSVNMKYSDELAEEVNSMENKGDFIEVVVNGQKVVLSGNSIFVDIFKFIDFDLSKPKGIIKLKLNGKDAEYSETLKDGDIIDIYWD